MKVVLKDLTKVFPSRSKKAGEEVVAVNSFNFEIPDGKLIGLLGPSGCGKSTTLYMISGLQKPSGGRIFFGEDDVTDLTPENRGIGLVFQNYALYPHMTVKQNILFPLQNLKGKDKLSKQAMLDRAYEVARLVQIDALMDRKPSELSGGQQQRVAIARALVKMPRVLLLDEPLSNLDARLRLQTREEIRRIQRSTGITTIFVTHDQEEAMSISDYIVVMRLGVVQQTGKPQTVYDDPANLFVAKFLGTPPINVFNGKIEGGKLYIGGEDVLDVGEIEDQEVYIGIRPEGFTVSEKGRFTCKVAGIDVMGRDISVISNNDGSINPVVRSIISADDIKSAQSEEIKYNLKPHKVFIFNKETENRIYFGQQIAVHESIVAEHDEELVPDVLPVNAKSAIDGDEQVAKTAPKAKTKWQKFIGFFKEDIPNFFKEDIPYYWNKFISIFKKKNKKSAAAPVAEEQAPVQAPETEAPAENNEQED